MPALQDMNDTFDVPSGFDAVMFTPGGADALVPRLACLAMAYLVFP